MNESNHRLWHTETPSHKISHDEYYVKWGTSDKTKHKLEHRASTLQSRIRHTRITTEAMSYKNVLALFLFKKNKILVAA